MLMAPCEDGGTAGGGERSFVRAVDAMFSDFGVASLRTRQRCSIFDQTCWSQGTFSCGTCPTMRTGVDAAPIVASTAGRGAGLTFSPIAIQTLPISAAITPTRITLAAARALPSWLKISSLRTSFEFPSINMASPAPAAPFYNAESAR